MREHARSLSMSDRPEVAPLEPLKCRPTNLSDSELTALYEANFRSVEEVAQAEVSDVCDALMGAVEFPENNQDGFRENKEYRAAKVIRVAQMQRPPSQQLQLLQRLPQQPA